MYEVAVAAGVHDRSTVVLVALLAVRVDTAGGTGGIVDIGAVVVDGP